MSRRRYITSAISRDKRVNAVAMASDFAALLYTWLITHATDDACVCGDPEELLYQVFPGRRDKTVEDMQMALELINDNGLFEAWHHGVIYFPPDSFYKQQSYIPAQKRRKPTRISEERR